MVQDRKLNETFSPTPYYPTVRFRYRLAALTIFLDFALKPE